MSTMEKRFRKQFGYENLVGAEKERFENQEFFIRQELDLAKKEERERIAEIIMPLIQKFIDKVESGRARSVETYQDMKNIKKLFSPQSERRKERKV